MQQEKFMHAEHVEILATQHSLATVLRLMGCLDEATKLAESTSAGRSPGRLAERSVCLRAF